MHACPPTPDVDQPVTASPTVHGYRLVIQSIGSADARLVPFLKRVLPHPEQRIAQMLYQAPSELIRIPDRDAAERICAEIAKTGVRAAVLEPDAPFEPGKGDHEVALVVRDIERIYEVVREITALLGIDAQQAKAMLCREPCVLLGDISRATAETLEQRLNPLGAELDMSQPALARYDVLLGPGSASVRQSLRHRLTEAGIALLPDTGPDGRPQPLLATDIDYDTAKRIWAVIHRVGVPCRIENRDFQRCDVTLDKAADSPELRGFLRETIGMPDHVVGKALARLPLVLRSQVRLGQAQELLVQLQQLGAQATAHLRSSQRFGLTIDNVGNGEQTDAVLRWLGEVAATERERVLRGSVTKLDGPFTHLQARWLVSELKRTGTQARMFAR